MADGFGSLITDMSPDEQAMSPETYRSPLGKVAVGLPAIMAKNLLWDLPKQLIGAAQDNPLPGLRREDYTDIPGTSQPVDPLVEASTQTAMNALGTAAPFAKPGTIGVFGGKSAKTADLNALAEAQKMHAAGHDKVSIWDQTGWFQGPDQKWRFEIPDNRSVMPTAAQDAFSGGGARAEGPASSVLSHPDLYAAYPDLANIPTVAKRKGMGAPRSGSIARDLGDMRVDVPTVSDARDVMLHELQHAVQGEEGFTAGGSPSMFKPQEGIEASDALAWRRELEAQPAHLSILERNQAAEKAYRDAGMADQIPGQRVRQLASDPESNPTAELSRIVELYGLDKRTKPTSADKLYRQIPGEIEARNVQRRKDMSPEERRKMPPWVTEDRETSPGLAKMMLPASRQEMLDAPYSDWHSAMEGPTSGQKSVSEGQPAAAPAGQMVPGGGGPLGAGSLPEAQAKAARWSGDRAPLEGIPGPLKIGDEHFVPGPIGKVHDVADAYMREHFPERPYKPPTKYHQIDPEHSQAIARAYEDMKHTPDDPATKASYDALIDETAKQYEAIKKTGLKIEPIRADMEDPYAANPRLAAHDVAENNHLWFFPTEQGFGTVNKISDNPMLRNTGEKIGQHDLLANDMFRIVHDYFGHLKEGHGFRAAGEDNAWRTHSAMYSDLARPAMTTETRGQNSWVNYGPHGEKNRKASAADTVYADQKVGLMPEWTMRDRGSPEPTIAYHGTPYAFTHFNPARIGAGEGNQAYGHGLYFAEHSPVSEWYRHQLASRRDPLLEKYGLSSEDGARIGIDLASTKGDTAPVIKGLKAYIKENQKRQADGDTSKATANIIDTSQKMIAYMQDPGRHKGHMYQVAIDHPPEHFLDWDAALKDQHPTIQQAVRPVLEEQRAAHAIKRKELLARGTDAFGKPFKPARLKQLTDEPRPLDELKGEDVYQMMGLPARDQSEAFVTAAQRLKEKGVPGIRYLDQASRLAGGGTKATRNFVTFDAPRILKRYAIPGAIGGAGFGSLAQRDQ